MSEGERERGREGGRGREGCMPGQSVSAFAACTVAISMTLIGENNLPE